MTFPAVLSSFGQTPFCMSNDLHSASCGVIRYTAVVPAVMLARLLPGFIPIGATGAYGDILLQQSTTPEAIVWYNNYLMLQNDQFTSTSKLPKLELQFSLNNSWTFHGEGIGERELHDGSFNISYVPSVKNQLHMEKGRIYTTLDIHLTPLLIAQLAQYFPVLNLFLKKVGEEEAAVLCPLNQLTTMAMTQIIEDILQNPYTGQVREFYTANKVMELLIVVLEKITHHPTIDKLFFREDEVKKIYEAKDELLKDLEKPMTLVVLARKVGLNIHKLRTGFNQFYGMSVIAYRLEARMKEARSKLDGTADNIEEIGFATGYANAQHFSKAFKKYYGRTPAQHRKENQRQEQ